MLGQAARLYELNSLTNPKAQPKNYARIISISSGKGGTGKSFIASNLSFELAQQGNKVLLVDLDINLANQNVLFNVSSKKNLYHYLTYNQNLEDIIYEYSQNLHLVLGESGKLDHPKLDEDRVKLLIREIRELVTEYDYILLDTSSGIENGTLQLLFQSDEIILVTTPEPTSVMDGYAIFKLLKSNGSIAKTNVIVNKSFSEKDGSEAFENLEKATNHFLKTEINLLGVLSFSADVVRSIQDQNLLVNSNQSHQITSQIAKICSNLKISANG